MSTIDADDAALASGEAWDAFCESLKRAGRTILASAPDHPVDRAEGIRYLTRLTRLAWKLCLEHADPAAPELIQYMGPTQKFGVDNPDQLYLWARIAGRYAYRLHGTRGSAAYLGIGVYGGSAGRGGRRTIAHVHAGQLVAGPGDTLDVILSAERPSGAANWIELPPDATTLLVRQTRNDPSRETLGALRLDRIDAPARPDPLTPARVVKGLGAAARQIEGSIAMFVALAERWRAAPNVLHPMDERMAKESFGDPDLYYSGGYWKLAEGEALVVDFVPPRCRYWSFLLCNYWTESLEYRWRPVWTNGHRAVRRADGSVRIVVADRDPGLPGVTWLDTEGHREGTMTLRWLLADATPVPSPRVVRVADLASL